MTSTWRVSHPSASSSPTAAGSSKAHAAASGEPAGAHTLWSLSAPAATSISMTARSPRSAAWCRAEKPPQSTASRALSEYTSSRMQASSACDQHAPRAHGHSASVQHAAGAAAAALAYMRRRTAHMRAFAPSGRFPRGTPRSKPRTMPSYMPTRSHLAISPRICREADANGTTSGARETACLYGRQASYSTTGSSCAPTVRSSASALRARPRASQPPARAGCAEPEHTHAVTARSSERADGHSRKCAWARAAASSSASPAGSKAAPSR